LVWAIGVSLVFLLKLIESCGEQLINLAGFLIYTRSRNWVSLVFLLKLIESCGEQLINLAGFLISTGSRNRLINCMWTINWVSGTFFASGAERTRRSPCGEPVSNWLCLFFLNPSLIILIYFCIAYWIKLKDWINF